MPVKNKHSYLFWLDVHGKEKRGCTNFTALSVLKSGMKQYVYIESSRKKIYVPGENYGPNVHYTL